MNGQNQPNPPKIFVYGTLKPGGRNYFLAQGVTNTEDAYLGGYTLLHFEPEGYPAMVPSSAPGEDRVYGVILTFANLDAALPELDAVEGLHGHGYEIIRCREERGGFTDLRQLDEVPGLSGKATDEVKARLTV